MWLRLAAVAAFAVAPCAWAQAVPPDAVLTLDDAFARVAQSHPDLRLADGQRRVLFLLPSGEGGAQRRMRVRPLAMLGR